MRVAEGAVRAYGHPGGPRGRGPRPGEWDLLGLWLAAVPVVVWGAPLETYVVHRLPERWLVGLLAVLAIVEVATTVILVEDLRRDPALVAYGVIGLAIGLGGIHLLARRRARLLALGDGAEVPAPVRGSGTRGSGATGAR